MEIIDKGQQIILNLINASSKIDVSSYIKSIYNIYIPIDDKVILYNTFTKAICLCDNREYSKLMSDNYEVEFSEILATYGFLVPANHDEMSVCDQVGFILNSYDNANYIDSYTILTTTNCNARCSYCYESNCRKFDMTIDTAEKLIDFIESNNVNNEQKTIKLSWFGGEPLYNYKIIDYIIEKLKSHNFAVKSSMISNGFLFNDALIKIAKENWNLKKIQITLDGTEEQYNKIKNYIHKEFENPFERVCLNIEKLLANDIRVAIRLNATKDNFIDLYKLVDYINVRFSKFNNFYVYTGIVTDYSCVDEIWNTEERNELIKNRNTLEEYIYSLGLKNYIRPSKLYKISQCIADNKHSIVVYPDGSIGKCEHFEQENIIGDLFEDNISKEEIDSWKLQYNTHDMCRGCAYYPMCIRLVKCPAFKNLKCNPVEASYYLTNLKHSVISVYKDWLNNTNKKNKI